MTTCWHPWHLTKGSAFLRRPGRIFFAGPGRRRGLTALTAPCVLLSWGGRAASRQFSALHPRQFPAGVFFGRRRAERILSGSGRHGRSEQKAGASTKRRAEKAAMLICSLCFAFPREQEGNFGLPGGVCPAETWQRSSSRPEQQRAGGWSSRTALVWLRANHPLPRPLLSLGRCPLRDKGAPGMSFSLLEVFNF